MGIEAIRVAETLSLSLGCIAGIMVLSSRAPLPVAILKMTITSIDFYEKEAHSADNELTPPS